MAMFSTSKEDLIEDLQAQVAALRKETAKLRKAARARGAEISDEVGAAASRAYDDLAAMAADYGPRIRDRARDLEVRARENPAATAAIGLVALGVLACLMAARRR